MKANRIKLDRLRGKKPKKERCTCSFYLSEQENIMFRTSYNDCKLCEKHPTPSFEKGGVINYSDIAEIGKNKDYLETYPEHHVPEGEIEASNYKHFTSLTSFTMKEASDRIIKAFSSIK